MSECDATVGQVAKGTTASFALGPHGASVCGCVEEALPGVGVVGGVFGDRIVPFAPVGAVFGLVFGRSDGVCGAFAGVGGAVVLAVGVFESASAAFGAAEGETGAKRSASDGAGGADVDEATEEGAAERRLC